jgi:predicted transcriptional regulator
MSKKKPKRTGGWPKRDRESVIVRLSPAVVEHLTAVAEALGCSRNQLIEWALSALVGKPAFSSAEGGRAGERFLDLIAETVAELGKEVGDAAG